MPNEDIVPIASDPDRTHSFRDHYDVGHEPAAHFLGARHEHDPYRGHDHRDNNNSPRSSPDRDRWTT